MRKDFLEFLVDPKAGQPLNLECRESEGDRIISGFLHSSSNRYPIVRGVPRFAGYDARDQYARSFGYQWSRWATVQFEDQNRGGPMEGHTLKMWERIVGAAREDLQQQVIVDFGCGPGRFVDVVRRKNGRVIGLDLSLAVEVAAEHFREDPDVLICQADVLSPPIRPDSADGAFSIGVLHHTPNPRLAFGKMVSVVKRGGWVASSVYGRSSFYDFPTVKFWRTVFRTLWPMFRHFPPLIYSYLTAYGLRPVSYVPLVGTAVRALFPFVRYPDKRWSVLDTFDSVTPTYQSTHESYEVFQWYKQAGLVGIEPSDWGFTSYHARKP